MKHWFLIAILGLTAVSCRKAEDRTCLKAEGDIVQVERTISNFTGVELNNGIDLVLVPDTEEKVVVEAGENLVNLISTEMHDTTLVIEDLNACGFLRNLDPQIQVSVHFKTLNHLDYNGYGDISCADTIVSEKFDFNQYGGSGSTELLLKTDSLFLMLRNGAGDMVAKGTSRVAYYFLKGEGFLDARELEVKRVWTEHWGLNDMHVWCWGILVGRSYYQGKIYYYNLEPLYYRDWSNGPGKVLRGD